MGQLNLKGIGVALITPFKSSGDVDYAALSRLIDYQLQNDIDYLVILGTTAETQTLSPEEQNTIKQFIVSKVNGQLPLVVGFGGNNTAALVQQLKTIDFTGIDALLSVVPYYNKPSQEGIYQHYKALAQASPLPLVLYNVPGRTGVNMTAETTLRLARESKNIIGVKEASGNLVQASAIVENKPDDFLLISGDDGTTFPLITLGAAGVISVIGNAFPKTFSRMVHLALSGDYQAAEAIHNDLAELFELSFIDGNPAGVKSMLTVLGFIENELRLPLTPTQTTTHERIFNVIRLKG